jgi:prevent-host-death family protein
MADESDLHKGAATTRLSEASADDVRRVFGDFLNRAGFGNERIVIVRHGKQVAALVGMSDLERLTQLDPAA